MAFGLANILSSVPITPGGLGIVEGIYIPTLVGFGLSRSQATLGVISYRVAQYWLPILLGGLAYLSLRVGPWSIERRDRLERLPRAGQGRDRDLRERPGVGRALRPPPDRSDGARGSRPADAASATGDRGPDAPLAEERSGSVRAR